MFPGATDHCDTQGSSGAPPPAGKEEIQEAEMQGCSTPVQSENCSWQNQDLSPPSPRAE